MIECPYCLDEIEEPDKATECKACGTLYHPECWAESDGCCIKDCPSVSDRIELDISATDDSQLTISSEAAEKAIPHSTRKSWNPCLRCGRHLPEGQLYCRECRPEMDEGQDARNAGPLLVILVLIVLVVGFAIYLGTGPSQRHDKPSPPRVESPYKR